MTPLVLWICLALFFVIAEIFTATFFLLCLGIGAGAVVIAEFFVGSSYETYFTSQTFLLEIILFVIVSGLFMLFLPKMLKSGGNIKTAYDIAIGKEVQVEEKNGRKYIRLESQDWRIANEDDFDSGEKGVILRFEGTRVVLEKK